jgi:polyhydroxyalkanoate synthesis regulator protein
MEMFQRTFAMFAPPFARREGQAAEADKGAPGNAGSPSTPRPADGSEIDDLKRQMEEMQKRLERLGSQDPANKEPGKE